MYLLLFFDIYIYIGHNLVVGFCYCNGNISCYSGGGGGGPNGGCCGGGGGGGY